MQIRNDGFMIGIVNGERWIATDGCPSTLICKVSDVKGLTDRVKDLEASVAFLWSALDNISTAGDVFKSEVNEYFEYVQSQCQDRGKVAFSDEYRLFDTKTKQEL